MPLINIWTKKNIDKNTNDTITELVSKAVVDTLNIDEKHVTIATTEVGEDTPYIAISVWIKDIFSTETKNSIKPNVIEVVKKIVDIPEDKIFVNLGELKY